MKVNRRYAPKTLHAMQVLGEQISTERRTKKWTQADLAERANIAISTLQTIEKGSPKVAIGTVLEVAGLLGIPLVGASRDPTAGSIIKERMALLPQRIRQEKTYDDDF